MASISAGKTTTVTSSIDVSGYLSLNSVTARNNEDATISGGYCSRPVPMAGKAIDLQPSLSAFIRHDVTNP